jgi:hypothetical protein
MWLALNPDASISVDLKKELSSWMNVTPFGDEFTGRSVAFGRFAV